MSCLDDKIELNNRINANLEAQAQAIFKSWFVDFEPFQGGEFMESELGMIPKGWRVGTLDDMCLKITDGSHFSPKESVNGIYPMLSVKDMELYGFNYQSCKMIDANDYEMMISNDCVPLINDILVAKDGSYLKHIFIVNENRKEAILSSIAIFRPDQSIICPELLLCMLKYPVVQQTIKDNYVSGSALPRIVLKDFKKLKLILPPMMEQKKIYDILSAMYRKIAESQAEISNLVAIRDTLLPRLMAGEIEVAL
jgi:type I restriction enzyme S subunit